MNIWIENSYREERDTRIGSWKKRVPLSSSQANLASSLGHTEVSVPFHAYLSEACITQKISGGNLKITSGI